MIEMKIQFNPKRVKCSLRPDCDDIKYEKFHGCPTFKKHFPHYSFHRTCNAASTHSHLRMLFRRLAIIKQSVTISFELINSNLYKISLKYGFDVFRVFYCFDSRSILFINIE